MVNNKDLHHWRAEYYFKLAEGIYVDLNVLMVLSALDFKIYETFPRYPQKEFLDEAQTFRKNAHVLINHLINHLKQYRERGRNTVLRGIWSYLLYQEKNRYTLGTEKGLNDYANELKSRIHKFELKNATARSELSVVQRFLIFNGALSKTRYFGFNQKAHYTVGNDSWNSAYTSRDFKNIVKLLMDLYDSYESIIDEHIHAYRSGYRSLFITNVPIAPIRMSIFGIDNEIITKDLIIGTFKLNQFFVISLLIFALFTWGNTTQLTQLRRQEIKVSEDGSIDTEYVFKGRGFRFVRLSIGRSEFDGSRSGLRWFNRYLSIRKKLLEYLNETLSTDECDYLFPSCQLNKTSSNKSEWDLQLGSYSDTPYSLYSGINGLWEKILSAFEQSIPKPTIPRFRKTAEQMTDSITRCPFTIMEKSQHSWETYRHSYARGNPTDSLKNISKALETLAQENVEDVIPLKKRQIIASEFGVTLFSAKKSIKIAARLPNGLGCQIKMPPSDTEIKFLNKQNKMGRNPKVCADLSNCVYCPKSCIIDTPESVYHLLSFRECIRLGKPTWIGSPEATKNYESILTEIELRLRLIDPLILKKANQKIRQIGPAAPWSIY